MQGSILSYLKHFFSTLFFCRVFSELTEAKDWLISGGNDRSLVLWNWKQSLDGAKDSTGDNVAIVKHGRKVSKSKPLSDLLQPRVETLFLALENRSIGLRHLVTILLWLTPQK